MLWARRGRILEAEALHVVAEFGQSGGGRSAGQAGAHDDDVVLALVGRIDQLQIERCLSQRVSMGPAGILESSSISLLVAALRQPAGQDRDWNRNVAYGDRIGEYSSEAFQPGV